MITPRKPFSLQRRSSAIGFVDSEVRHLGQAEQPPGIGGAELPGQPVVVSLHAGAVERRVGVAHEVVHRALARVEELGVDAVLVHVLETRLPVEAASADGVVGVSLPADVLEAHARRGHEADVHQGLALAEGPGVTALLVLHEARRPVVEGLREPVSQIRAAARGCGSRRRSGDRRASGPPASLPVSDGSSDPSTNRPGCGGEEYPRPMIRRLSHLGICVADLERSLRFYREGLGFREVSALELSGEPSASLLGLPGVSLRARYLERDGARVELLHYPAPGATGRGAPRPDERARPHAPLVPRRRPRRGARAPRRPRRRRARRHPGRQPAPRHAGDVRLRPRRDAHRARRGAGRSRAPAGSGAGGRRRALLPRSPRAGAARRASAAGRRPSPASVVAELARRQARRDHHRELRREAAQRAQAGAAVHAGHVEVEDHERRRRRARSATRASASRPPSASSGS